MASSSPNYTELTLLILKCHKVQSGRSHIKPRTRTQCLNKFSRNSRDTNIPSVPVVFEKKSFERSLVQRRRTGNSVLIQDQGCEIRIFGPTKQSLVPRLQHARAAQEHPGIIDVQPMTLQATSDKFRQTSPLPFTRTVQLESHRNIFTSGVFWVLTSVFPSHMECEQQGEIKWLRSHAQGSVTKIGHEPEQPETKL